MFSPRGATHTLIPRHCQVGCGQRPCCRGYPSTQTSHHKRHKRHTNHQPYHIDGYYPVAGVCVTPCASGGVWRWHLHARTRGIHRHTVSGFHLGWRVVQPRNGGAPPTDTPGEHTHGEAARTLHHRRHFPISLKRCSNARSTSVALMLPSAFEDSMVRGSLRITLRFAFRCVLHRCENQDIRCPQL